MDLKNLAKAVLVVHVAAMAAVAGAAVWSTIKGEKEMSQVRKGIIEAITKVNKIEET